MRADVSSTRRCFSSASLSPSFIRNADEPKPRSGFHFYTSLTLQSLASPSIRPLVLSSHAVIEKQAPVLIGSFPLRVQFGPVFLALHACARQRSREASCPDSPLSRSVTSPLFTSKTPAQDVSFIRFPFWVCATVRGAGPDPDLCASQLGGSLRVTGNANRKNSAAQPDKRSRGDAFSHLLSNRH